MKRPSALFFAVACAALAPLLSGCPAPKATLEPTDAKYKEAISAFFSATLALQVSDDKHIEAPLKKALELLPGEPAVWANKGVYEMRKNQADASAESFKKARELAPDNADIALLEGTLYRLTGKFEQAQTAFERAAQIDPKNLKASWLLADTADQLRGPDADKTRREMYTKILDARPNNLAAQIALGRTLATSGDKAGLLAVVAKLQARASSFPPAVRPIVAGIPAVAEQNVKRAALSLVQALNLLKIDPNYRASLAEVESLNNGDPIPRLIKTPNPTSQPAPSDAGLKYAVGPLPGAGASASFVLASALDAENPPAIFSLEGAIVKRTDKAASLPFPLARPGKPGVAPNYPLCAFDYTDTTVLYSAPAVPPNTPAPPAPVIDFRGDLAVAGGGLRLYQQKADNSFLDATAAAKLPPPIIAAPYSGVWTVDIEADGDLDLILSSAGTGGVSVLQNNGDGTFLPLKTPFPEGRSPVRAFAWADFDSDGDPDAAFIDANGALTFYSNERSGRFKIRPIPVFPALPGGRPVALAVANVTADTRLSLLILTGSGDINVLTDTNNGDSWETETKLPKSNVKTPTRLFVADMDNNGAVDLIVAGESDTEIFLSDAPGKFADKPITVPLSVQSVADLNKDGLLDCAGIAGGKPVQAMASATQNYKWQNLTLKAAEHPREGDRINPFCIGGEAEVRAGLLYQKQPITAPQLHFGLGTYDQADATRITWPNGNPQGEFDLKTGAIVAEQRLGGSCPFLYAWDGKKMSFVTDCIWRSPLGLKINAQTTAGVTQTEDWVKVRGDQLQPKDGFYNLSVTAELRETHFFDRLSLVTVDHPKNTEIFIDERFSPTKPPRLEIIPTGPTHPVKQAMGTDGADVTALIAVRDGKYLDDFGRGQYQGVTRDHWVEIDLSDAPKGKPIYLLAYGWVHPTDTSINVALGQNPSAAPPAGLSIETPDAAGKWSVSRDALGFPEGKVKTIVLRVDDTFKSNAPRRLRLRTNLEIFWDHLMWAEALPAAPLKTQTLQMASATLRYRGFSEVRSADKSSPELPVSYDEISGTNPRWRDLIGFYTRFGDITPLLAATDDRYVIMNAGDEMRLRFPVPAAQPAPPAGWKRDYVLIGDGWVKDGNVNTAWGKTVLPLPLHDQKSYDAPPGRLEDDPAYRRHPDDWLTYHTRYVTADAFNARMR